MDVSGNFWENSRVKKKVDFIGVFKELCRIEFLKARKRGLEYSENIYYNNGAAKTIGGSSIFFGKKGYYDKS